MRLLGVAGASCLLVFAFAACGDDPAVVTPDADAGLTSSSGGTSSGGTSSGGTSSGDPGDGGAGGACVDEADCEGKCTAGACEAPSVTDGKVSPSLGETDVDCGGPTAPGCKGTLVCATNADCASGTCGDAKKCVGDGAPSCTARGAGTTTCGAGEPGAAGAANETCCRSLPLPVTKTRSLDRYEITSGRVRAFIEGVSAANGGKPNVRKFAKDFAAANPTSQLGKLVTDFPKYLDILPDQAGSEAALPLPVHLGAFPLDAINQTDGCYIDPTAVGAATYWQPPEDLTPYGIGYGAPRDGKRKYGKDVLDAKPANCMTPLLLATFCAWDGGELARTSDYREVWGRTAVDLPGAGPTVFVPWDGIVKYKEFNWRNGHGEACIVGWPDCTESPQRFYVFPATGSTAAEDDSPAIAAPGRFPKDVTKARSASGEGWFDVGGNLMEAAWPNTKLVPVTKNVCDTSAGPGAGATLCNRNFAGDPRPGTLRFTGDVPPVALVGYSFEVHSRRSEAYLAGTTDDETKIAAGDVKPLHFQYGKIGGRCARLVK